MVTAEPPFAVKTVCVHQTGPREHKHPAVRYPNA